MLGNQQLRGAMAVGVVSDPEEPASIVHTVVGEAERSEYWPATDSGRVDGIGSTTISSHTEMQQMPSHTALATLGGDEILMTSTDCWGRHRSLITTVTRAMAGTSELINQARR